MESRREYADDGEFIFYLFFFVLAIRVTSCFFLTLTATLKRIGLVCQILFTIEYGLKLATAPRRVAFVKAPANMVDLLAVAPFWLELIVQVCVEAIGTGTVTYTHLTLPTISPV